MEKFHKRIMTEYEEVSKEFDVEFVNDNINKWHIALQGPENSPYKDGVWLLEVNLKDDYPMTGPEIQFKTKIYHPNIKKDGGICMDKWVFSSSIKKLLNKILSLLIEPDITNPIIPELAKKYMDNKERYIAYISEMTDKFSKP